VLEGGTGTSGLNALVAKSLLEHVRLCLFLGQKDYCNKCLVVNAFSIRISNKAIIIHFKETSRGWQPRRQPWLKLSDDELTAIMVNAAASPDLKQAICNKLAN